MTNKIGLNIESSAKIAAELNKLLATYQVFYMNVRGYHWNIKGINFFQLHAKFEEIYNDLVVKIDEIAERILTLGHTPSNAYSEYLTKTHLPEHTGVTSAEECLNGTLEGFSVLLGHQREILLLAEESDDESTVSQMSDYIKEQEKLVWMFSSSAACCK
ncbi:starvation-inducible DNA-binding protein [Nicoletella semolina]|uniref:Starvation-inducible DNA-binding protein n=1 Tax=Nicoletella semolina TaxID=271160 RepID=A0A4R2NAS1_9PAST|nr:Dps family protein [Nicoletella semolina]MDH2924024.1 DNA starvation/stationary phase protection protein [Nicoletella semolina]TCP18157.1 starvation-inducible DNA-binding protein [Nicoletella semolina]